VGAAGPEPGSNMELTDTAGTTSREAIEAAADVHRYHLHRDRANGHKDGDWRWRSLYTNGKRTRLRTEFCYKIRLIEGLAKYPLAVRTSAVVLREALIRSSLFLKEKYQVSWVLSSLSYVNYHDYNSELPISNTSLDNFIAFLYYSQNDENELSMYVKEYYYTSSGVSYIWHFSAIPSTTTIYSRLD
jgi:hypothetical protein